MTCVQGVMAAPFPSPLPPLGAVLDELRFGAAFPPESKEQMQDLATLPRPWDPATCPHELRTQIYIWLEAVVAWINADHTWRVEHSIPICWSEHPHVVHELATVTCLRWEASYAVTPAALEEWQQHTLPAFLDRIIERIGTNGCPPGRHQPHPGTSRLVLYREREQETERRSRRRADSEFECLFGS